MASVTLKELSGDAPSMLILYVLGKMEDGALMETQFQKVMFRSMLILGMDPVEAGYRPHFYGPYSDLMTEKKNSLLDIGYLEESKKGVRVTEEERERVAGIRIPGRDVDLEIGHMVNYVSNLSDDETLLMTYCDDERRTGGRFTDESQIKQEVYRRRIPTAIGLYRRGKVSLDRAAELAGMSLFDFQDVLVGRHGSVRASRGPGIIISSSSSYPPSDHAHRIQRLELPLDKGRDGDLDGGLLGSRGRSRQDLRARRPPPAQERRRVRAQRLREDQPAGVPPRPQDPCPDLRRRLEAAERPHRAVQVHRYTGPDEVRHPLPPRPRVPVHGGVRVRRGGPRGAPRRERDAVLQDAGWSVRGGRRPLRGRQQDTLRVQYDQSAHPPAVQVLRVERRRHQGAFRVVQRLPAVPGGRLQRAEVRPGAGPGRLHAHPPQRRHGDIRHRVQGAAGLRRHALARD